MISNSRGELVRKWPVSPKTVADRVNTFIMKVQSSVQEDKRASPAVPVKKDGKNDKSALSRSASAALAMPVPASSAIASASTGVCIPVPPAAPVPESSAPVCVLTLEQAKQAAAVHSKCRNKGCSECMGLWFLPQSLWRMPSLS